jgi:hypothetical protein
MSSFVRFEGYFTSETKYIFYVFAFSLLTQTLLRQTPTKGNFVTLLGLVQFYEWRRISTQFTDL